MWLGQPAPAKLSQAPTVPSMTRNEKTDQRAEGPDEIAIRLLQFLLKQFSPYLPEPTLFSNLSVIKQ
jgi:hypothetical protein